MHFQIWQVISFTMNKQFIEIRQKSMNVSSTLCCKIQDTAKADTQLLVYRGDDKLLPRPRQFAKSLLPIISTDRWKWPQMPQFTMKWTVAQHLGPGHTNHKHTASTNNSSNRGSIGTIHLMFHIHGPTTAPVVMPQSPCFLTRRNKACMKRHIVCVLGGTQCCLVSAVRRPYTRGSHGAGAHWGL